MKLVKIFFIVFVGAAVLYAANASAEDKHPGEELYNVKGQCVACHGLGTGDRATGPDLKGVTKRRTRDWLTSWISDPQKMVGTDPIAQELLRKFNGIQMPKPNISAREVQQIIDYLVSVDAGGKVTQVAFKPLDEEDFEKGKSIFFDKCSGCHGAKRWGATGPSLLPNSHIEKAAEVQGGGTKAIGTTALEAILANGSPAGMPAWGREKMLTKEEVNLMARYVQMDPPDVPSLDLAEATKQWNLIVPVDKRPTKDESGGAFENYFGVILRDAGKVAIIDGTTKEMLTVVDTGKAVHILRSSKSGRYFYAIGRDGRLVLIDLWTKIPSVVARARTCWDARSVDSSKGPGFEDKYAIVGCYTPYQYAIMDGETLEPLSITSVSDSTDWSTGNKLPEVRIASIVASEEEPFWVINLKESGWIYIVDYTDPKKPKETRMKADNFLHDGGWVQIPGSKEKRYFLVAANAKNRMCVMDVKEKKVMQPCIETGKIPHPGRGANVVHPKYGPVYVTPHIGEGRLTFIGTDPDGHPDNAWKVVDTVPLKTAGSLFVKSHPNAHHLWVDFPLSSDPGLNGEVGVYDMKTGKLDYIKVSDARVVHFEYDKSGKEVWISGWLGNEIYVYNDEDMKLVKTITGDWIHTPTGKFNVYNTRHDIY